MSETPKSSFLTEILAKFIWRKKPELFPDVSIPADAMHTPDSSPCPPRKNFLAKIDPLQNLTPSKTPADLEELSASFRRSSNKLKRRASFEETIIAENAIHIGIDIGGTLIKVAMICKADFEETLGLDREIR